MSAFQFDRSKGPVESSAQQQSIQGTLPGLGPTLPAFLDQGTFQHQTQRLLAVIDEFDSQQADEIRSTQGERVRHARALTVVAYLLNDNGQETLSLVRHGIVDGRWPNSMVSSITQGEVKQACAYYLKRAKAVSIDAGITSEEELSAIIRQNRDSQIDQHTQQLFALHSAAWNNYVLRKAQERRQLGEPLLKAIPLETLQIESRELMEFNAFAVNYPQARRLIRFAQMVKNSALLLEGGGPGNQVQLNCYLEGALWAGASYGLLTTRELRSILALNNPAQQIYFLRDIWQRLAHRQREE